MMDFQRNCRSSGLLAQTLELLSAIYEESDTLKPTVSSKNSVIL